MDLRAPTSGTILARAALDRGARDVHARLLLRAWLRGRPLAALAATRGAPFPRALREALPELERQLEGLAKVEERRASADGSARLVVRLSDGRAVESVWLARGGVCVSTQVGCAVACTFCQTGRGGLERNLSAEEIAAQVVLARRAGLCVRRVVLMGMGEPAHNLEAVLGALRLLGGEGALAHKQIVFSTVGEPRAFERLLFHSVRPSLALSLHALEDERRRALLPRAPRVAVEELLAAALDYAERTTWPLLVQWTLLQGENDSLEEAERLAERLQGARAIVNYIPWNAVADTPHARPAWQRGVELVRVLRARGVLATLRRSAGADVDGACGQLRARAAAAPATAP
jgi:23S rRNA (adenine2503-C2)-methyltransferase